MRSIVSLALLAMGITSAASFSFQIVGEKHGAWSEALESLGLQESKSASDIVVLPPGSTGDYRSRVGQGTIIILQGESEVADSFGIRVTAQHVAIRSIVDARAPKLAIVWEDVVNSPKFELPAQARVFAWEKWEHAPVLAGFRLGAGAVVWLATDLGAHGYSRYPYLPQALVDLGFSPPFRSAKLWAFFDSSYRARADLDYLAPKWRAAGIAALHVASWHYWERDPVRDAYLESLIAACHRNAIQVYAWVELPHVSERFWADHPEWREKTAIGQDAQLDWRKLMNLTNRDAFRAVSTGLRDLAQRFDWDGLNLAELYFESLEGADNPARFTPFNPDVRADFRKQAGFDPMDIFTPGAPDRLKKFLDYRANLALRQQVEWIAQVEEIRKAKPWLDLVLTHVDDRLDPSMRVKIGADTSKTLPLLTKHDFTFLIEDPATTWNLGPQRYPQIASRYAGSTPRPEKLAIDINIVDRYQDVYPTKQQTGLELFQLVHAASGAFPRVALYFENSIAPVDQPLLSAAGAHAKRMDHTIEAATSVGILWQGPALVDGKPWPVRSASTLWLPEGQHSIERSTAEPALYLTDLNAELVSASTRLDGIEFAYQSTARAYALLDRDPGKIEIDGETADVGVGRLLRLPLGQHLVTIHPSAILGRPAGADLRAKLPSGAKR
ncbi:MAG: hypothetical protein WDO18_19495 [Acidobacteriota bacterium]